MARRVVLFALVGMSVSTPAFSKVALEVSGDLVVSKVDTTSYPTIEMVVAPPRLLAPRDLGPDAFSVTENGESRTVNVARLPNSGLQVVLVLDPSVPPERVPRRPGRGPRLPAPTSHRNARGADQRGRAAPGDPAVDPRPGGRTRAVGDLSPERGRAIYDAVRRADAEFRPADQARRTVVVFTGGRDTSSSIALNALKRQLTSRGTSLYAVELSNGDSGDALATVAAEAGGESVKVASTELVGAYQRVADVLLNQYRVTFAARSRGRAQLGIGVAADGISGESSLAVQLTPSRATAGTGRTVVRSERGGGRAVAEPLAATVTIAMALLAGGLLVSLGRAGLRSRSTPTGQRGAR